MVKSKQTDQVYSLTGKVKATTPKAVLVEYQAKQQNSPARQVWVPKSIAGDPLIVATCTVGKIVDLDLPMWFVEKNDLEDYVQ